MRDKPRILITGSNGFIGKRLWNYFGQLGYETTGYNYDFETPPPYVGMFELVIHVGAISSTTYRNVDILMEQNYNFTCDLISECNRYGTELHYASSAAVYGNKSDPKDYREDSLNKYPENAYAWSKYMIDHEVIRRCPSNVKGFRYFNVFGQGEEHKTQPSPVTLFQRMAKKMGRIEVFEGSENFKRDFVWVDDICRMHEQMIGSPADGIYNIGTGKATSFMDIALRIAEKEEVDVVEVPMPDELKNQYQAFTQADMTKFNEVIPDFKWTSALEYIDAL